MKKSVKSLAIAGIAVLGFLPFATPARAGWGYKAHEHPVTYFTGNPSQSNADKYCRDYIYTQIDWRGGLFTDLEHGYRMSFTQFARPYVWAHLRNKHCVINASWGYVRW
jgi:hypothetical protein